MMTLDELRSDFRLLDDWEDRYRFVIELGRSLEPLPPHLKNDGNKVRGCASQVWLATHVHVGDRPELSRLTFEGESDAHIVRGLIAILFAIYQNKTVGEIGEIDPHEIFADLGLNEHLTPQRSNGLAAMVSRIHQDARAVTAGERVRTP